MKGYEYTHLHIKDLEAYYGSDDTPHLNTDMIDELNKLGKEGWDLSGTVNLQQEDGRVWGLLFILKREL